MTTYNQDGKVGPWAEEKLVCLEKYLSAYSLILSTRQWCTGYYYFDAFAGLGETEIRLYDAVAAENSLIAGIEEPAEFRQYIEGSPLRALKTDPPFTKCFFVEKDEARSRTLAATCSEIADRRRWAVILGDANEQLIRFAGTPKIDWKSARAIAFVDPYGMQVDWATIEAAARSKSIELLINLPIPMAVSRLIPRSGEITIQNRERLNRFFPSAHWFEAAFTKTRTLFGDSLTRSTNINITLAKFYADGLSKLYEYVSPMRLVRNRQGTPIYYLIFCTNNKTGLRIASDILKQGETIP